jgi:hypothetical protein
MSNDLKHLEEELKELDKELVEVDGARLKPSQCYHYEANPAHILFNTNCPDKLKEKIQLILAKHLPSYESGA